MVAVLLHINIEFVPRPIIILTKADTMSCQSKQPKSWAQTHTARSCIEYLFKAYTNAIDLLPRLSCFKCRRQYARNGITQYKSKLNTNQFSWRTYVTTSPIGSSYQSSVSRPHHVVNDMLRLVTLFLVELSLLRSVQTLTDVCDIRMQ